MQLNQSPKININYCAKIVEIHDFTPHPNPKCERLKCAHIDGYTISVSKDTEPGMYVYFPIGCAIDYSFLSANNQFRHIELNADKEAAPGYFEDNGRVKIIKLQGHVSEGFIMSIESITKWISSLGHTEAVTGIDAGTEFDRVGNLFICKKYVLKNRTSGSSNKTRTGKQPKGLSKLVDNQFRFHYDTILIKKCPWIIKPNDIISITSKVHGTSGISADVLCKRQLKWKDKVAGWLTYVPDTAYDYLWSSRKVVKNQYYNKEVSEGYYGCDAWEEAHKVLQPFLTKGLTLYYEIIGWLPTGGAIQSMGGKAYDYGYDMPIWDPTTQTTPYKYNVHFGIRVYRITYTNPDGIVYEFSARQVQQWCKDKGLTPVTELYYGYAKDLYPDISVSEHWNENFIQRLAEDKNFFMEELSPECHNDVPHEGIVIRIEDGLSGAYKLKCNRFLFAESKALDKGEVDIESDQ